MSLVDKLQEWQKEFGDSDDYKLWISPLINVIFSALGNTAGIWVGYILIKSIFSGVWNDLEWPGINSIVDDGVLLIISFSFLTSVLYQSTRRLKINLFNVISSVVLVMVAAYYARVIAIEQSTMDVQGDTSVSAVSWFAFSLSLLLLYISLVYEKYVQQGGSKAKKKRDDDYDELSDNFKNQ